MKEAMKITTILLFLFGLIQVAGGCIMEDRVIELVVSETTCVDTLEYQVSESFVTPVVINYGEKISEILDENSVSRDDIVTARLVSASYSVTDFPDHADWIISGSITVERIDSLDGPATLWDYDNVSITGALNKKIPMVLNSAGVGVLNRALADFIHNKNYPNPVLVFRVNNADVTPSPSVGDPLVFAWRGCIVVDIVAESEIEVPDPF